LGRAPASTTMGLFAEYRRARVLETATTLLLAVHLLAMNVASAGPLAGAWLRRLSCRDDEANGGLLERGARATFRWSLLGLAIGALVGGAMLLAPSAGMRAALQRFPEDAYWFAGAEVLFSAACIFGCWKLSRRPKLTWLLAIVAATNLLYHFPPLMAVLGELAADPRWADDEVLHRKALLRLWIRPEVLSLWAHFALASIAVGFTAALAASHRAVRDETEKIDDRTARCLAGWALGATLLQIPVGIWLLLASDTAAQQAMMGESWLATIGLAGGVWAALGVMQSLAVIAWGGSDRRQVDRACILLAITVALMSFTLRASRRADEPFVQEDLTAKDAKSAKEMRKFETADERR
jgi:cytochrome bd-type quinol oxidase subunit 2